MTKGKIISTKKVIDEFECGLSSPKVNHFKDREAAELAALQGSGLGQSGSLRKVGEDFDRGLSSPTAESFKSREAAELEALRGQGKIISTQ